MNSTAIKHHRIQSKEIASDSAIQKLTIIIGGPLTGKTSKAKQIAKAYPEESVTWLYKARIDDCFVFSSCTKQTQLVIVEDHTDFNTLMLWWEANYSGIVVSKLGKEPFEIHPKVILTSYAITAADVGELGPSGSRRFEIIDLNEEGGRDEHDN